MGYLDFDLHTVLFLMLESYSFQQVWTRLVGLQKILMGTDVVRNVNKNNASHADFLEAFALLCKILIAEASNRSCVPVFTAVKTIKTSKWVRC